MESYLIEEYGVIEDKLGLTEENQIKEYFEDLGRELLNCGQGYYTDESSVICKIGERFYKVEIEAEIGSSKQDIGDRLYWVERVSHVDYEEIPKPTPKNTDIYEYKLILTDEKRLKLEKFLKENKIEILYE